ncbi:MAG TPA: cyclic nucleotide-binding domain-containing protein [Microlunatus sp.]
MSLYRSWLWFAARRRGLALDGDSSDPIAEPGQLERALEVVASTLHLGDADRELVLSSSKLERYGAGEIVLHSGVRPDHIRFIISGHASLTVEAAGGRIRFGVAEPGDYIGQTALTRERTLSTAVAADLAHSCWSYRWPPSTPWWAPAPCSRPRSAPRSS